MSSGADVIVIDDDSSGSENEVISIHSTDSEPPPAQQEIIILESSSDENESHSELPTIPATARSSSATVSDESPKKATNQHNSKNGSKGRAKRPRRSSGRSSDDSAGSSISSGTSTDELSKMESQSNIVSAAVAKHIKARNNLKRRHHAEPEVTSSQQITLRRRNSASSSRGERSDSVSKSPRRNQNSHASPQKRYSTRSSSSSDSSNNNFFMSDAPEHSNTGNKHSSPSKIHQPIEFSDTSSESDSDDRKMPAKITLRHSDNASNKPQKREPPSNETRNGYFTRVGAKRRFRNNGSVEERVNGDGSWRKDVEDALRDVRKERTESKKKLLEKSLRSKNALLRQRQSNTLSKPLYPVLNLAANISLDSSQLKDRDSPLPRDNFNTIFIKKHFSTDGSPGEEDESSKRKDANDDSSTDFDSMLKSRSNKYAKKMREFHQGERIGLDYEKEETYEEIDKVIERLRQQGCDREEAREYLALLLHEDSKRVHERFEQINKKQETRRLHDTPYKNIMSSFRDLFCRRCVTYDCNLHGLAEEFCPTVQAEIAIQREISGYWMVSRKLYFLLSLGGLIDNFLKNDMPQMCLPVGNPENKATSIETNASNEGVVASTSETEVGLSEDQKTLCQKLYDIFQGNLHKVSSAMGLPQESISKQVAPDSFEFRLINPSKVVETNRGKNKNNKSTAYNPAWIKNIVEKTSHPFYYPCHHSEPCSETTCSCIQNGFFCTKSCIWGSSSRNFFRGCNCLSHCKANSCPCFASNRECDPNLCKRCGACTDAPNKPVTNQPCQNDNIGMRRHAHLLVGKSTVAGWGLFPKYALKKGDYIHEYLGEMIPHDEAERRGAVYDERDQTYLFDLSEDYAVDALRMGNKTRFINHSPTPNIAPRLLTVNGDIRIGFYANTNISAQTEVSSTVL